MLGDGDAVLPRFEVLIYQGPFTFKHLLGGVDAKGVLKILHPCKGPWKKYHQFSSENWVYMLSYGVDP